MFVGRCSIRVAIIVQTVEILLERQRKSGQTCERL